MRLIRVFISIAFISNTFAVHAQNNEKLNIVFQQFEVISNKGYQPLLYEKTFSGLVNLNKFNVITRTPEMWKAIENELAIQDFIDPKTAIHLGNMLAAKYLIEGSASQLECEQLTRKKFDNTVEYYFSCVINATLNTINLETGQYGESVSSKVTIENTDRNRAIQLAVQQISDDLIKRLSKKFLIRANIVRVTKPDILVINKGYLDGVQKHDSYNVLLTDKSDNKKKSIASFKITEAEEHEARGRIIKGDINSLTTNNTVEESATEGTNVVKVETKEKDKVYINAGDDLGIEKGNVFLATEKKEIKIGEHIVTEDKVVGKVYITEVRQDYAKA